MKKQLIPLAIAASVALASIQNLSAKDPKGPVALFEFKAGAEMDNSIPGSSVKDLKVFPPRAVTFEPGKAVLSGAEANCLLIEGVREILAPDAPWTFVIHAKVANTEDGQQIASYADANAANADRPIEIRTNPKGNGFVVGAGMPGGEYLSFAGFPSAGSDGELRAALSYDPANRLLLAFANGAVKTFKNFGPVKDISPKEALRIGSFRSGSAAMKGEIRRIAIYNRALEETELISQFKP
jgi:hypothetical protein